MIEIDGSHGEGGGQLLRTALFLSLLTGSTFRMHSIRANRVSPGLRWQQLAILELVQQLAEAEVSGDQKGSTTISFKPKKVTGGKGIISTRKAIAIPLILQAILPIASIAFGKSDVEIEGATDVSEAIPFDHFVGTVASDIDGLQLALLKRGFYPGAGGQVRATIQPIPQKPLIFVGSPKPQRALVRCIGSSGTSPGFLEEQGTLAMTILQNAGLSVDLRLADCNALSLGAVATVIGIGQERCRIAAHAVWDDAPQGMEHIGAIAAEKFVRETAVVASVDRHTADNLIPWLAIRGGEIEVSELTEHCRTNIWVCQRFLGDVIRLRNSVVVANLPVPVPAWQRLK